MTTMSLFAQQDLGLGTRDSEVYIGNPESETRVNAMPFNFYWQNNLVQSIYYEDEIGTTGAITKIAYNKITTENIPGPQPVKIWMTTVPANITQFATTASWFSLDNFTLVYEGLFDAHLIGENTITLSTPFPYEGGNLVIFTNRVRGPEFGVNNYFQVTVHDNAYWSLHLQSDTVDLDPENPASGTLSYNRPNITLTIATSGGESEVYLGNPESEEQVYMMPFNFYWQNNLVQSIYYEDEIGTTGAITKIAYNKITTQNIPGPQPVKIWMTTVPSNITQFATNSSWFSLEDFTLVYDGLFNAHLTGENAITLNTPFPYDGGNLVIYTNRVRGPEFGINNYFQITTHASQHWSLHFQSDTVDLDPENPPSGTLSYNRPNVTLTISTGGMGSLSGVVSSAGNFVAGAVVSIDGSPRVTTTNAAGQYLFEYLDQATINLTVVAIGYFDQHESGIDISSGVNTVHNISLDRRPFVSVTGTVHGSDTNTPISNANVSLTGYDHYTGFITNTQGVFTLPEVYSGYIYTLVISADGYDMYLDDVIEVGTNALNLGVIILDENSYRPSRVKTTEEGDDLHITWEAPYSEEGIWASHIVSTQYQARWGISNNERAEAMHRFTQTQLQVQGVSGGELTSISIFFNSDTVLSSATYTIKVYTGGTATPNYHPGTLVYSQLIPNPILNQWNVIPLLMPIEIPSTGELWFGYEVAVANLVSESYEISTTDSNTGNIGYGDIIWDVYDGWGTIYNNWYFELSGIIFRMRENHMIRGLVQGSNGTRVLSQMEDDEPIMDEPIMKEQNLSTFAELKGKNSSHFYVGARRSYKPSSSPLVSNDFSVLPTKYNNTRSLDGYSVYRLKEADINNEMAWTTLIDNTTNFNFVDTTFNNLPSDIYYYAVKSNYTNYVFSFPTLSSPVNKGVTANTTINVYSTIGNLQGATVLLVNNDNANLRYEGTVNAASCVIFPSVRFGNYTLTMLHQNIFDYVNDHVEIAEATFNYDIIIDSIALLNESFEGEQFPPPGWTRHTFAQPSSAQSISQWLRIDVRGYEVPPANTTLTGNYVAISRSWGGATIGGITPDNWLITPAITINSSNGGSALQAAILKFYVRTDSGGTWGGEQFSVYASTSGNLIDDFDENNPLYNEEIPAAGYAQYREINIGLSAYLGQTVYIGIRHHDCFDQNFLHLEDVQIAGIAQVSEDPTPEVSFISVLNPNYPNPFNPSTTISFTNMKEGKVTIEIFNIRGQKVHTLVNDFYKAGQYQVTWYGTDDQNRDVGSGIYFYQMKSDDFTQTRKMILIK